jgi:hypothetical protein
MCDGLALLAFWAVGMDSLLGVLLSNLLDSVVVTMMMLLLFIGLVLMRELLDQLTKILVSLIGVEFWAFSNLLLELEVGIQWTQLTKLNIVVSFALVGIPQRCVGLSHSNEFFLVCHRV